MQIILEEICQNIRNFFVGEVKEGAITINDGAISINGEPEEISDGRYYRIVGSYENDGIYIAGTDTPTNETFAGEIWLMRPSPAFLALVEEIKAWQTANGAADSQNLSPYTSESFGGYSYSKSGGGTGGGTAATWQGQYAARLNAWRKI